VCLRACRCVCVRVCVAMGMRYVMAYAFSDSPSFSILMTFP